MTHDSRISTHAGDPLTPERITDLARMLDEWAVQRKPVLSVGERHILEDAAKGLRELATLRQRETTMAQCDHVWNIDRCVKCGGIA